MSGIRPDIRYGIRLLLKIRPVYPYTKDRIRTRKIYYISSPWDRIAQIIVKVSVVFSRVEGIDELQDASDRLGG